MSVRIRVDHAGRHVEADGLTIAAAVRAATGPNGFGIWPPGRTIRRTETAPGVWDWDWSGKRLTVTVLSGKEILSRGASGKSRTYERNRAAGGGKLGVLLPAEEWAMILTMAKLDGSLRQAAILSIRARFAAEFAASKKK